MKLKNGFLIFIISFFASQCCFAVNASDVATIDLYMAFCLHPKMALFDFNRIGFYKVELGLKEDEFRERARKLCESAPNKANEIEALQKALFQLHSENNNLPDEFTLDSEEKRAEVKAKRKDLERKIKQKELEITLLNHQIENYDLTSLEETKKIVTDIEKDIFDAINEVVKENNYSLVLNSSNPCAVTYRKNYVSGGIYGQGIPDVNFILFYSFLAMNNLENPWDEVPPSRDLINWMELTRYPDAMNLLPMRPYPLVLSGGKSILSDVMKKVYSKHKIDSAVQKVVDSVIIKLEYLQNGQKLEQKVRKFDF